MNDIFDITKEEIKNIFTEDELNTFKSNNWRRLHGLPLIHKHGKVKRLLLNKNKQQLFNLIENTMNDICMNYMQDVFDYEKFVNINERRISYGRDI